MSEAQPGRRACYPGNRWLTCVNTTLTFGPPLSGSHRCLLPVTAVLGNCIKTQDGWKSDPESQGDLDDRDFDARESSRFIPRSGSWMMSERLILSSWEQFGKHVGPFVVFTSHSPGSQTSSVEFLRFWPAQSDSVVFTIHTHLKMDSGSSSMLHSESQFPLLKELAVFSLFVETNSLWTNSET